MRLPWLSRSRRVRYKPLVAIPFIGREGIIEDLQQHIAAVKAGQTRFVALEGPAGSGKSSLLSELVFVNGRSPDVLFARVEASAGLLEPEFYVRAFAILKAQCEGVLDKLYNDTKRFRKFISEEWDEQEFREFLASADWSPYATSHRPAFVPRGRAQSDPMRQLLEVVSQHPWAIACAAAYAFFSQPCPSSENFHLWTAHWGMLLQRLAAAPKPTSHALVLLIDHLELLPTAAQTSARWQSNWRSFIDATQASGLPVLVIWSGLHETLLPLKQAVTDADRLHVCRLHPLADDEQQALQRSVLRALPRTAQSHWQEAVRDALGDNRTPGLITLAALWMVASSNSNGPDTQTRSWPTTEQEAAEQLVQRLVDLLCREQAEHAELLTQLLGIFAFWSAGKTFLLDDIVPFVDFESLGLEPTSVYTMVERQLGACVRYGLLQHDAFTAQFSTVSAQIQRALRRVVVQDAHTRAAILWRRRLAAAVIDCLRHRQEGLLPLLAAQIEAMGEYPDTDLAAYLTIPMCRMLQQISKDEKFQIAQALGQFPSPLAITPLAALLGDADEQIRSRVAQSLADLDRLDTYDTLLRAVRDLNSDVRWIAAMALGKKKHPPVVDVLIELLSDEDKEVGRIAAQGLAVQGDVRAVTPLIDATQDRYPLLRESAAHALGQLADRRAVPALQSLCQDNNRQVRQRAEAALASFSSLDC